MLYFLEQGDTADFLKKMAMRMGQATPDRIANAPELLPGLELYYRAFWELDSERSSNGYSIGRIPWSKAILYAEVYDFDNRQRDNLVRFIKKLDTVYIQHFTKDSK